VVLNDPLVRLSGVSFSYEPGHNVLDRVNLELQAGDRIGLAGPNGGGKTTLLHIIVGLTKPASGTVEVFGRVRNTEADFVDVRKKVQLLFQDAEDQLFSPTVIEDVAFGPLNLGKSREEAVAVASETLAVLGLRGYEDKITHHLSGGEKRLVSLATILAMKPRVLLLDEPESGLDEDSVDRLVSTLSQLDLSMIAVSHHREFLERITTSGLVLRKGRLDRWKAKPGESGRNL
jgi:cobalt/nickel transport system ATP-binding protein